MSFITVITFITISTPFEKSPKLIYTNSTLLDYFIQGFLFVAKFNNPFSSEGYNKSVEDNFDNIIIESKIKKLHNYGIKLKTFGKRRNY